MILPLILHSNSRAIVPIGIMFSLSLICGNLAYLYLSVSFIQMLKVRIPACNNSTLSPGIVSCHEFQN